MFRIIFGWFAAHRLGIRETSNLHWNRNYYFAPVSIDSFFERDGCGAPALVSTSAANFPSAAAEYRGQSHHSHKLQRRPGRMMTRSLSSSPPSGANVSEGKEGERRGRTERRAKNVFVVTCGKAMQIKGWWFGCLMEKFFKFYRQIYIIESVYPFNVQSDMRTCVQTVGLKSGQLMSCLRSDSCLGYETIQNPLTWGSGRGIWLGWPTTKSKIRLSFHRPCRRAAGL